MLDEEENLPLTLTPNIASQSQASQETVEDVLNPWGRLISLQAPRLQNVDLIGPSITIGRAENNNILLCKSVLDEKFCLNISKYHCAIYRNEKGIVYIRDLSKNGTFVNSKVIGKGRTFILQNNDKIAMGHIRVNLYIFKSFNTHEPTYLPPELSKRYFLSTFLGRGGCGEVRLVYEKTTCKTYAVKKIAKSMSSLSNHPNKIKTEINIMTSLANQFVIGLKEIIETESDVFIVLEYMQGGELTTRIKSETPMTESQIKHIFYQIVLGVKYLHENGIVHRDLKPENVLLSSNSPYPMVKISDFGLSKVLDENNMMRTICGTPHYVAPEVLNAHHRYGYGPKVDVWSLGVILYYMLCRKLPIDAEDQRTLYVKIMKGCIDWTNNRQWLSLTARNLVMQMLTVDPEARIGIEDILRHPWISRDVAMQWKIADTVEELEDGDCSSSTSSGPPPAKRQRLMSAGDDDCNNDSSGTSIAAVDSTTLQLGA